MKLKTKKSLKGFWLIIIILLCFTTLSFAVSAPIQNHPTSELMPGLVYVDDATVYGGNSYNIFRNYTSTDKVFFNINVDNGSAIYARSDSKNGIAIYGYTNQTANGIGVKGLSRGSALSKGIYGLATNYSTLSNRNYGVKGVSDAPNGTGVYGNSKAYSSIAYGIGALGLSNSGKGKGVYGLANATSTINYGIYALTTSTINNVYAAYGRAMASSNSVNAIYGDGTATGVHGKSFIGIYGYSPTSTSGQGVYGYSSSGYGIYGYSSHTSLAGAYAIHGETNSHTGASYGVYADSYASSDTNRALEAYGYKEITGHTMDNCVDWPMTDSSTYVTGTTAKNVTVPDTCKNSNCHIIVIRTDTSNNEEAIDIAMYYQNANFHATWKGARYTDAGYGKTNGAPSYDAISGVDSCTLYLDKSGTEESNSQWSLLAVTGKRCYLKICT